jgi:NAD+ synthase
MSLKDELKIDPKETTEAIVKFIKDKIKAFKRRGIILGISGGIDSACVAALSVRANGNKNVLGLIMPERDSNPNTKSHAELVAKTFGIKTKFIDLHPMLECFGIYSTPVAKGLEKKKIADHLIPIGYKLFPLSKTPFVGGLLSPKYSWMREVEAYYRVKHRLRMTTLYYWGEYLGYLVVGTSNKTESLIGFFVKYGDGAADIMPIESLYKTQVRMLAQFLGVPQIIIDKKPSPDILPGITDELAIGISYEKLDSILLGISKKMDTEAIARDVKVRKRTVEYAKRLITLSNHMRNPPEKWEK